MIIEFFGLSNTGKSTLKRKLIREGYPVLEEDKIPYYKKIFFLLKHLFINPINSFSLFYFLNSNHLNSNLGTKTKLKVLLMRNTYLAFVLSKYELVKNSKKVIIDEFSFQSLFMILQKNATRKEVEKILAHLPKSEYLFLFDGNKKLRYIAYEKKHPFRKGTLMPGSQFSKDYAKLWMKTMENNFEIAKEIINKKFREDNSPFNEIKKYPSVLRRVSE